MKRDVYDITVEPQGRVYDTLMMTALRHCDRFLFVDVPEPRFGENDTSFQARSLELVRELQPHFVGVEKSKTWPGTTMGEQPGVDVFARVYHYRLNADTLAILTSAADHLYAWQWPDLPTDLCLLRADGEAWLVTIASDEESYLLITKDEAEELGTLMPELELERQYPQH